MVGAAMWTALIAKDNELHAVKVANKGNLGITVTPGPTLCGCSLFFQLRNDADVMLDLVWVSFALMTLSVAPYVISGCTYRK
jgi:hypothetical protein